MGEWDNTAYVRTSDLDGLERALAETFAAVGYRPVAAPRPRRPAQYDQMQYGGSGDCDLWGIALAPGAQGWAVVKTAPFELLCERGEDDDEPLLADLARALGCDAFQVNLYDGDSLVLLEASAAGTVAVSGFSTQGDDPTAWNGFQLEEDSFEAQFALLEVAPAMRAALGHGVVRGAQIIRTLLSGDTDTGLSNELQVEHLIPHRPCELAAVRLLYYRAG